MSIGLFELNENQILLPPTKVKFCTTGLEVGVTVIAVEHVLPCPRTLIVNENKIKIKRNKCGLINICVFMAITL